MAKMIIIFICMSLALFGSSKSASFHCKYRYASWSTLGKIYYCSVQNVVNITSLDEAQVDDISGTHQAGYNNDNVEAISVNQKGQINYFPRGLNKFFKNLKGIEISNTQLKEVHQSDLKDYPKLTYLVLYYNQLEILEENLFEFNPNLECIFLNSNKISHIYPNMFDKLTKLNHLILDSNTCINMNAENNPAALQKIIKTAKAQCKNSDYSNLEHKVKYLEMESENLNSENFKEKQEKLENEIKSSKFPNFFQLQIRQLKAAQTKKAEDQATTTTTEALKEPERNNFQTCLALELKINKIAADLKDLWAQSSNETESEQCATKNNKFDGNFSNLDKKFTKLSETVAKMDENVENLKEVIMNFHKEISKSVEDEPAESSKISKSSEKIEKFDIKLENLSNFKTFSYKKFDKMENEEKVFHASIKKATEKTLKEVEMKIGEIEAKIDRKFDEIDGKFEEMERKFGEKFVEILKIVKNGE